MSGGRAERRQARKEWRSTFLQKTLLARKGWRSTFLPFLQTSCLQTYRSDAVFWTCGGARLRTLHLTEVAKVMGHQLIEENSALKREQSQLQERVCELKDENNRQRGHIEEHDRHTDEE